MEGRRGTARSEKGAAAGLAQLDFDAALTIETVGRADPRNETDGLMVTTKQRMLAVVEGKPGVLVREGEGAAAEKRPAFHQHDAKTRVGQMQRRGDTGNTAANDDCGRVGIHEPTGPSQVQAARKARPGFETRTGRWITAAPASATRSSREE